MNAAVVVTVQLSLRSTRDCYNMSSTR